MNVEDINDEGLPKIYFSAISEGSNKIYLNKEYYEFKDLSEKTGVAGKRVN